MCFLINTSNYKKIIEANVRFGTYISLDNSSNSWNIVYLYLNQFIFRHKGFHYTPCYEVGYGTDTENDEVSGFFSFKT